LINSPKNHLRESLKTAQLKNKSEHYQGFTRLKIIETKFLEVLLMYSMIPDCFWFPMGKNIYAKRMLNTFY